MQTTILALSMISVKPEFVRQVTKWSAKNRMFAHLTFAILPMEFVTHNTATPLVTMATFARKTMFAKKEIAKE